MERKQIATKGRRNDSSDCSPERHNVTLSFEISSVLGGKITIFDDFGDFGILELFEHHGWVEFSYIQEPYYPELVKKLYKNLRIDVNGQ